MRHDHFWAAGAAVMLVAFTITALGQSRHLEEAMTHAQAALMQGRQGYPDALVTQAQEALKGAELAREESPNQHLDKGISLLKTAIDQGKQGKGEAAANTIEGALTHLSASSTPPSGSGSGDGGTKKPMR